MKNFWFFLAEIPAPFIDDPTIYSPWDPSKGFEQCCYFYRRGNRGEKSFKVKMCGLMNVISKNNFKVEKIGDDYFVDFMQVSKSIIKQVFLIDSIGANLTNNAVEGNHEKAKDRFKKSKILARMANRKNMSKSQIVDDLLLNPRVHIAV